MTALEGHPFTRRGDPELALGTAILSSGLAGIAASVVLIMIAPLLAQLAILIGPSDYAALAILGLACVSAALGSSILKGIAASLIGLFVGTIGIDRITSTPVLCGPTAWPTALISWPPSSACLALQEL